MDKRVSVCLRDLTWVVDSFMDLIILALMGLLAGFLFIGFSMLPGIWSLVMRSLFGAIIYPSRNRMIKNLRVN